MLAHIRLTVDIGPRETPFLFTGLGAATLAAWAGVSIAVTTMAVIPILFEITVRLRRGPHRC